MHLHARGECRVDSETFAHDVHELVADRAVVVAARAEDGVGGREVFGDGDAAEGGGFDGPGHELLSLTVSQSHSLIALL
jgi:hypothetical protein